MTTVNSLNSIEKLERRVDVSAEISDYVYDYEKQYNILSKKHKNWSSEQINIEVTEFITKSMPQNTSIIDAVYDKKTGVAAIAVDNIHVEPGKVFIFPDKTSRLFRTL